MMNALLVLALLAQDADLSVTGKAMRQDKDYELTVSGKGKALQDQEIVSLRFRRLANRVNWADGAIVTETADDGIDRVAKVEHQAFVHAEAFPAAGEVEVHVGVGAPETSASRQFHRVFRTASPAETAHAIGSDAAAADAAIHGLARMLDDVEALQNEPPPKRQQRLQKRVDWRKHAYRQEVATSSLSASARALSQWMDDLDAAAELERSGKDLSGMLSTLTGTPFSRAEARNQLSAIEAVSLRERGLLIVREIEAVARGIAAAVSAGDARAWGRQDKEFTRTLELLRENDARFRGALSGGRYAALVDLPGGTLDDLIVQTVEYLQAAAACIRCTPSSSADVDDLGRKVLERAASFEVRIRTQP